MDAVTYPDPEVKKELLNWLAARVDVSLQKGVAELFSVAAIPVALAVTAEGRIVGRVTGFLVPESFKKEIATLREGLR